jgi:tripeptidyl-peptidase I
VLFSSGDGGVSGSQGGSCKQFIPVFPAALPWVTGIGATQGAGPETAASFSGGGFSNYWPRSDAPYQTAAVAAYLANTTGLPPSSRYNGTAGAGFPDISVAGVAFNIVVSGSTMQVDGTSCSTPTFAGIVSLLNDARAAAGKGSLGWLNPLLYANPGVFTDITEGNNPGCGTQGFPARAGWDPVTGLGTPKFPALLALALAQP